MEMNLTPIPLAIIAALNLSIGLYVYRCAPHASQNRAFGFLATATSLWTTGLAFAHYSTGSHTWALRIAFASASLIPLGILVFADHVPVGSSNHAKARMWLFIPVGIAFCLLSFSPAIVVSVTQGSFDRSGTTYGPLHPAFAAYVIACFGYSVWLLTLKYRVSTGLLKLQIRYLLFAFVIPTCLATASNLLIPLLLKTSALSKYGPVFTLVFLALVGHAIIRHRLLDVRIVIKRSVVYLAAFVAAGLILITLLVASNLVLHDQHRTPLREIVLALAVAVFFSPLKGQIQRAFDRYLYREPYDYQRTIREASRALGDTIELPRLLSYIRGLVVGTLKCEGVAIYLLEND